MFCGFGAFFFNLWGLFVVLGLLVCLKWFEGIFLLFLLAMGMAENVQGSWCSQEHADPGL